MGCGRKRGATGLFWLGLAVALVLVGLMSCGVDGDVYMHNPRGHNDRLNEESDNRRNNQRICDTQNNAKGGYCWGPPMTYYVGSILSVEWTNQHSCNNPKAHCEIILQYMCGDDVRDGTTTDTIPDNADPGKGDVFDEKVKPDPLTKADVSVYKYGMNEDYQYYQSCKKRERNYGLWTADQLNVNDKNKRSAIFTRQDNAGTRHAFECPEERDYYPYWHPTPWKDIAVLTSDESRCEYYRAESQNVKEKGNCTKPEYNHLTSCVTNGGEWVMQPSWDIPAPECVKMDFTRDNHLGNSPGGYNPTYNWTIPNDINAHCVLRIRYNVTTGDYDGWDSSWNHTKNGVEALVLNNQVLKQDPNATVSGRVLALAINTDQYGRTFQDRSYAFAIEPRPDDVPDSAKIYNLNVRGKRGNIVQVYPAVEYDFVPERLHTKVGDYIHFQWTGCDTNPKNNDGEGTRGTDRSNIVQMNKLSENFPDDTPENPLFEDKELRRFMAFLNQTDCLSWSQLLEKNDNNKDKAERDPQNCMKLNAAPAYVNGGLMKVEKEGEFHYMSTRNNNFSNRSQKGVIISDSSFPGWLIAVLVVAGLLAVFGVLLGVVVILRRRRSKGHNNPFKTLQ